MPQPTYKKVTFQIGVDIIGLPLYHTHFIPIDTKHQIKKVVNKFGNTNDGRHTWKYKREANLHLTNMLVNNSIDTIKQIFGETPKFEVRLAECRSNFETTRIVFPD